MNKKTLRVTINVAAVVNVLLFVLLAFAPTFVMSKEMWAALSLPMVAVLSAAFIGIMMFHDTLGKR